MKIKLLAMCVLMAEKPKGLVHSLTFSGCAIEAGETVKSRCRVRPQGISYKNKINGFPEETSGSVKHCPV